MEIKRWLARQWNKGQIDDAVFCIKHWRSIHVCLALFAIAVFAVGIVEQTGILVVVSLFFGLITWINYTTDKVLNQMGVYPEFISRLRDINPREVEARLKKSSKKG